MNREAAIKKLLEKKWYFQGFNAVPALLCGPADSMTHDMPLCLGYGYPTGTILFFEHDVCYYLYCWDDLQNVFDELWKRCADDGAYLDFLMQKDKEICVVVSNTVSSVNLKSIIQTDTTELFTQWRKVNAAYGKLLSVSHSVEGFSLIAEEKIRQGIQNEFPSDTTVLETATTPTFPSFITAEQLELATIALACETQDIHRVHAFADIPADIQNQLKHHVQKWSWKRNSYTSSKTLSTDAFVVEINEFLTQPDKMHSLLANAATYANSVQKRDALIGNIKNAELHKLLRINIAIGEIHDRRKEFMIKTVGVLDRLLQEVARRFTLPITDLRYIAPHEFEQLPGLAGILQERRKKSVYFFTRDCHDILTGTDAEAVTSRLMKHTPTSHDIVQIQGTTASPGKATGAVKVCRGENELEKMQKGDILVACMTQPEFVPAMKKAAAIVTDEGGLTCHAAILSRELGIPCVIGTKNATKILKDGDMVEVDATQGVVHIILKV